MPSYLLLLAIFVTYVHGVRQPHIGPHCEIQARLQSGRVCGTKRVAENRTIFASFLGVPYASQPVKEKRFSELEPVKSWDGFYDATVEGPACPQHDIFYGPLLDTTKMSEACIYANIHVPINALPGYNVARPIRNLQPPYETGTSEKEQGEAVGLPIFVFVHGGGFAFGSGSTKLYGPEYLMDKNVIVVTFNYRLNVFGFLSLNSSSIPGNNGLRDVVTLLRWLRENAKSFGGDPNNITLGGQSAGASIAHLVSMSVAAEGLLHKVILMSGTGIPSFYTTSPAYAEFVANLFLSKLGINSTNADDIHQKLIQLPLKEIMEANKQVQEEFGLTAFLPVVETPVPGFTTILDEDPEILLSKGCGNDIPLIIGFTNAECESFRPNFEKINILSRLQENPTLIISLNLVFKLPPKIALDLAKKAEERYFDDEPTMDNYVKSCSETYYKYPAIKLAQIRALTGGAPVFLYEYSYDADFSIIRYTKHLKFKGAGHVDDMAFVFRANSMNVVPGFSPPTRKDHHMSEWMTLIVKNFMYCNDPTCNKHALSMWPPVDSEDKIIQYQDIETPMLFSYKELTKEQQEMMQFFDSLQNTPS